MPRCDVCGRDISDMRAGARYCGSKCRQKAHRKARRKQDRELKMKRNANRLPSQKRVR